VLGCSTWNGRQGQRLVGAVSRWQDRAACRGVTDRRWDLPRISAFAARICLECPVRIDCFGEALDRHHTEDVGIWGGTTPGQRDAIRRRRLTLKEAWKQTHDWIAQEERLLGDLERWIAENVWFDSAEDRSLEALIGRTIKRMRQQDGRDGTQEGEPG